MGVDSIALASGFEAEKITMAHPAEEPVELDWYALSEEEICQFDEQGYLIVRNVLDQQTIDRIIEVSDRLMAGDRCENRTGRAGSGYDGFRNCIADA